MDFVGESSGTVFWAKDANYVYFRLRVNVATVTASTFSDVLWIYIKKVGYSSKPADYAFAWDTKSGNDVAHGLEMQVYVQGTKWSEIQFDDLDGAPGSKGPADINGNSRTTDGYIRAVDGQADSTSFIDWAVSWTYLETYTNLRKADNWYVGVGSRNNTTDHNPLGEYANSQSDLAGLANFKDINITQGGPGWGGPIQGPSGLIAYDGFNYTPNQTVIGQGNNTSWPASGQNYTINVGSQANALVEAPSMTPTRGLLISGGQLDINGTAAVGGSAGVFRSLGSTYYTTNNIYWFSAWMHLDAGAGNAYAGISLFSNSTENIFIGQRSATTFWGFEQHAGIGKNSTVSAAGNSAALLVVQLDGNNNTANLYVNPASMGGSAPATASATFTFTGFSFNKIRMQAGNEVLDVDEFRFGTTYADVTPSGSTSFSGLSSQSIFYGASTVTLSGTVSASGPVYPANGETVGITINGVTYNATITGGNGAFSVAFPTATIPYSATPYTITYTYGGGTSLNAAQISSGTLTVSRAILTVTGITAPDRIANGSTAATLSVVGAALQGVMSGDTAHVTLNTGGATGTFDTAAVGTGKVVTVSGLTITGSAAGNYTLVLPTTTATIFPAATDHYSVTSSAPPFYAGVPFTIYVAAKDAYNNTVTANNGTVITFSSSSGNMTYDGCKEGTYSNNEADEIVATNVLGLASISVKDGTVEDNVTITASDPNGKTGTSSPINISTITGAYRTQASGTWSTLGIWQSYNGSAWLTATAAPDYTSGVITVQSGHTVTVAASVSVDQVHIASGGQVTVDGGVTLTVMNNSAPGLELYGSLANSGAVKINSGSAFVVFDAGILINSGTVTPDGTLRFFSGGTYQHRFTDTAGTIPTADWYPGSICAISGYTSNTAPPGGLDQHFRKLVWNCPNQVASIVLGADPSIVDDFTLLNTGSGGLTLGGDLNASNPTGSVDVFGALFLGTHTIHGGVFKSEPGATLGIGSAAGIADSGSSGNVQTTARNYSTDASYIYNGAVDQGVGSGLPAVVRSLSVASSHQLTLSKALRLAGDLSIGSGSTLAAGSWGLEVGGHWTNDGNGLSFSGGQTVSFTGSATHYLAGANASTFAGLAVGVGSKLNLVLPTRYHSQSLNLGGSPKAAGTWGAAGSGAVHIDDGYFAGIGTLNVASGPVSVTTISASAATVLPGNQILFTATVSGANGMPTGTVTFKDGGTELGNCALNGSGQATLGTTSLASGDHTIQAEYQGSGTYSASSASTAVSVGNPGTSSNPVGTLSTGSETWVGDGSYTWQINDATGTAGRSTGWDLVNITGDLDIQSSATDPFVIDVVSLEGAAPGSAVNFNCRNSYTWPIATVSGSVLNFNATKFTVNTSQFQNFTGGGTFSVVQNTKSVDVVFSPHACVSGEISSSWGVTNDAIHIMIQDAYGLKEVVGLKFKNCTMTAKAYGTGDSLLEDLGTLTQDISKTLRPGTVKVICIGTRITIEEAWCNARAYDLCGAISGTIDPVITTMEIGQGGSVLQTFSEIPSYERFVTVQNGVPGIKRLSVVVNGSTYVLDGLCDGETRTVDVGGAMIAGDANTVIIKGEGAAGASAVVTIGDTATTPPLVVGEAVALRIEKSAGGLELSWPVAGAGLELQSRSSFDSQDLWTAWPQTPKLVNGRYVVTVPGNPTRFFRLHKP